MLMKVTCTQIDVAILRDRNVIKKEAENIPKYKDVTVEILRVCNVKRSVIRIIKGTT
jgi:hypothetical protein